MRSHLAVPLIAALSVLCTDTATAQESPTVRGPQYELAVTLIPESRRLEASGTLRLSSSDAARNSIQIQLSDLMQNFSAEVVEPQNSKGQAKVERHQPGSTGGGGTNTWDIVPHSPFPAGAPILLRVSWAGGHDPGNVFYLGPQASFASGFSTVWYPQLPDPAGGTSAAIGRITFRAPKGYVVVASGAPEGESERSGEFRFLVNTPTHFSFATGKYSVVRELGSASTSAYLLRPRESAQAYLDGCMKILQRLEEEYGPDPYGNTFSIVEVPTEELSGSSGASFPNFILVNSAALDAPFNPALFGHEMGHIWWGNLIRQKGDRGRYMLDEGMAQYSALVALEQLEGPGAAQQLRLHGDPASPVEESASTYFALVAAGLDHPLSQLPNDWNSRNLANSKGPIVMSLLGRSIGQARFREILHRFTKDHAFEAVTWEQFVEAFNAGTQGKSRTFFAQWFDRVGAPDWHLAWTQEGNQVRGAVTQVLPGFTAVVDVEIVFKNGRRIVTSLKIQRQARTDFSWQVDGDVRDLILDPEYQVLHWTPQYHKEAPLLAAYWAAFVKDDTQHEAAIVDLENAIKQMPADDTVGARFMLEELMARLLAGDDHRLGEAKAHLERGLMSASRRTERLGWAYFLLGYIASKLGDDATLQVATEGAVASDALASSWSGWGPATRALRSPKSQNSNEK
jgi:hypothetical protein